MDSLNNLTELIMENEDLPIMDVFKLGLLVGNTSAAISLREIADDPSLSNEDFKSVIDILMGNWRKELEKFELGRNWIHYYQN